MSLMTSSVLWYDILSNYFLYVYALVSGGGFKCKEQQYGGERHLAI